MTVDTARLNARWLAVLESAAKGVVVRQEVLRALKEPVYEDTDTVEDGERGECAGALGGECWEAQAAEGGGA